MDDQDDIFNGGAASIGSSSSLNDDLNFKSEWLLQTGNTPINSTKLSVNASSQSGITAKLIDVPNTSTTPTTTTITPTEIPKINIANDEDDDDDG